MATHAPVSPHLTMRAVGAATPQHNRHPGRPPRIRTTNFPYARRVYVAILSMVTGFTRLLRGSCSSVQGYASGFLPTPPHDGAVASGSELAPPLPPGDFHAQIGRPCRAYSRRCRCAAPRPALPAPARRPAPRGAARPLARPAASGRPCPANSGGTTRPGAGAPGRRSDGPAPPLPGRERLPGGLGDHRPPVQRDLLVLVVVHGVLLSRRHGGIGGIKRRLPTTYQGETVLAAISLPPVTAEANRHAPSRPVGADNSVTAADLVAPAASVGVELPI